MSGKHAQVAFATGYADAVEILADGNGIFPRRAEQIANFGDACPGALAQTPGDALAQLRFGVGMEKELVRDRHEQALRGTNVEEVLKIGRIASRLRGKRARIGRLKARRAIGLDDFVFQFTKVRAQLRL